MQMNNLIKNISLPLLLLTKRNYTATSTLISLSEKIKITFKYADGYDKPVIIEANVGQNFYEACQENKVENVLEFSCAGSCSCSTCHIYIDDETFKILDKAGDEEEDMLDLATGI